MAKQAKVQLLAAALPVHGSVIKTGGATNLANAPTGFGRMYKFRGAEGSNFEPQMQGGFYVLDKRGEDINGSATHDSRPPWFPSAYS